MIPVVFVDERSALIIQHERSIRDVLDQETLASRYGSLPAERSVFAFSGAIGRTPVYAQFALVHRAVYTTLEELSQREELYANPGDVLPTIVDRVTPSRSYYLLEFERVPKFLPRTHDDEC